MHPYNIILYSPDQYELIHDVEFWGEGVFQCVVAVSGLLANIMSAFILMK